MNSLRRLFSALAAGLLASAAAAQGLDVARLGVVYNLDEPDSRAVANLYAAKRDIPPANLVGVHLGVEAVVNPTVFKPVRDEALRQLPTSVQSLVLVWSVPYAVGCMSVTTAMAAGYRPSFCEPGCGNTEASPLFDADGWLPADTVGWWPSMLLPTSDLAAARQWIDRGLAADRTRPRGTIYLVRTQDRARNVRAPTYEDVDSGMQGRLRVVELTTPVTLQIHDALGYFTGAVTVAEMPNVHFVPGAIADHLTSSGGNLRGHDQMPATAWLLQGATASYGTVSEPCNNLSKFPNIEVLLKHYLRGDTVLEAYWKSVAMPGQGLFIGEPLARPFGASR